MMYDLSIADEIGKNQEVLKHMTKVPIVIRVLVTESQQTTNDGVFKLLQVQEEIVQVDGQVVRQIKVTQLVMKLDSANNEMIAKREITAIELDTSDVHNMPTDKDTHKYPDGRKLLMYFSSLVSLLLLFKMFF